MGSIIGEVDDVLGVPILGLENPEFTYSKENILPGYTDEADFYVINYDDENTNEVLMKYYLKIEIDKEIPLKIELTDENGNEVKLSEEGRSEEWELPYDKEMRTKYHLKISWNKEDNSYTYAGSTVNLKIDVIATQVVEAQNEVG